MNPVQKDDLTLHLTGSSIISQACQIRPESRLQPNGNLAEEAKSVVGRVKDGRQSRTAGPNLSKNSAGQAKGKNRTFCCRSPATGGWPLRNFAPFRVAVSSSNRHLLALPARLARSNRKLFHPDWDQSNTCLPSSRSSNSHPTLNKLHHFPLP